MVIVMEGIDCVGKSTQINRLQRTLERDGGCVFVIHCEAVKSFDKDEAKIDYKEKIKWVSENRYAGMLKLAEQYAADPSIHIIFDRAHLGEYVYSPIYRGYDGSFVFLFEKMLSKKALNRIFQFVFVDEPERVIARDKERGDGQSFSLDVEKKRAEIQKFIEAYNLSSIKNSYFYNIKDYDAQTVGDMIETVIYRERKLDD